MVTYCTSIFRFIKGIIINMKVSVLNVLNSTVNIYLYVTCSMFIWFYYDYNIKNFFNYAMNEI